MPYLRRLILLYLKSIICSVFILSTAASGLTLDSAAQYTHDTQFTKQDTATSAEHKTTWDEAKNFTTSVTAGGTYSVVKRRGNDSSVDQIWDGRTEIDQRSGSISLSQDFYKETGISLGAGRNFSQIASGNSWFVSIYQWFLLETLQVSATKSNVESNQNSISTLDRDAFRVITPAKVTGETSTVSITSLFTTTTILESSYSLVERSDRPDANNYSLGVKQFIKASETAVHAKLDYFVNLGEIKPVTLQGETTAQGIDLRILQRVMGSYVFMAGYRYYTEHEDPRAENAVELDRGSDYVYGRITYRMWKEVWTHPANELYLFGGNYRNSDGLKATSWGLGAKVTIN